MFYPAAATALRRDVDALLAHARQRPRAANTHPKAIIAPHAGYVYSGPIAATAYALLDAAVVRRVVLLGPTHRVAVRGLALPGCSRFATPLGEVTIDAAAVRMLSTMPQVTTSAPAHALEHSLEVHVPFLQSVLGDFTLVPLAVGDAHPAEVAEVIDALWGGPETLIVVSSDLSHYLPYDRARTIDRGTADAIVQLDPVLDHDQACGATPVSGLLIAARRRAMRVELLDLRNSGDTAGDKSAVVGYASFGLYEPSAARSGSRDSARTNPAP
jgi:MEMO1 family protein